MKKCKKVFQGMVVGFNVDKTAHVVSGETIYQIYDLDLLVNGEFEVGEIVAFVIDGEGDAVLVQAPCRDRESCCATESCCDTPEPPRYEAARLAIDGHVTPQDAVAMLTSIVAATQNDVESAALREATRALGEWAKLLVPQS